MYIYICMCIYISTYIYMYVCMYVCNIYICCNYNHEWMDGLMGLWIYLPMDLRIYALLHLCFYTSMHLCRYAGMQIRTYACTHVRMYATCPCVHVCMCACMFQLCHGIPALCKSPIRLNNQHRKFQGPRPWCQLRKEPNRNRLSVWNQCFFHDIPITVCSLMFYLFWLVLCVFVFVVL